MSVETPRNSTESASRDAVKLEPKPPRGTWGGLAGRVLLGAVGCALAGGATATAIAGVGYAMGAGALEYLVVIVIHVVPALVLRCILKRSRPRADVLVDTCLILLLMTALVVGYTALKVQVPLINEALWDAELAAADRIMSLGLDPNVFLVTIFADAPPLLARLMDTFYTNFVGVFLVFAAWYITHPERRHRLGFATGWSLMWATGAFWYVAMPSMGPVFFTNGLWGDVAAVFPNAAALQTALIANYSALVNGTTTEIIHVYGVAAIPSLHVATHAFLWLWARATGSRVAPLFLAMTLITWIGSVMTGWHYAVDGLAGLLLAWICCHAGRRSAGLPSQSADASLTPNGDDTADEA